ncbi:COP23 domain-containing protein [Kamptonema formosum]|uniref:COP23 domain-containing protein n=1 Tax=Kamptonema formosum TaxID=331992 RepID=UPI00037EBB5D|nr:COP23 domain-containing protein [Oscillatoria sp. PCC 10802]
MKLKLLASTLTAAGILLGCDSTVANPPNSTTFVCDKDLSGIPTTFAVTSRGRVSVIKWISEYFTGSGWNPEQRCQEVSERFQQLYSAGRLNYLSAGRQNGQPVLCALRSSTHTEDCALLFTLKPGDDATRLLEQLRQIARGDAAAGPVLGGIRAGAPVVNMRNFLKNAPVE